MVSSDASYGYQRTIHLTFGGFPMCSTIQFTTYSCALGVLGRCEFVSVECYTFGVSPGGGTFTDWTVGKFVSLTVLFSRCGLSLGRGNGSAGFGPLVQRSIEILFGIPPSLMFKVCYPTADIQNCPIVRSKNLEYVSVASLAAKVMVSGGRSM